MNLGPSWEITEFKNYKIQKLKDILLLNLLYGFSTILILSILFYSSLISYKNLPQKLTNISNSKSLKFPVFYRVCFSSYLAHCITCFSVVAFACWTGKCVGVASKNRGNGILHALKDFTYSNDDGDKRGAQRKFAPKRGRAKGAKSLQNAVSVKCELVAATRRHTQRDTHTWQLQPENSQVERKWLKSFLCKQHLTNNQRERGS